MRECYYKRRERERGSEGNTVHIHGNILKECDEKNRKERKWQEREEKA